MAVRTPRRSVENALEASLVAPRSRTVREGAFGALLLAVTLVGVFVLGVLLVDVLSDGAPRVSLGFLTDYFSRRAERTGVLAGITGTLSLMLLVALFAFPIGVGAAIYLEEFAPNNRFTRLIEANINNLAGVPSIVYGLLGLGIFYYVLGLGASLLTGALTLMLLVLPVIIVAGRESLRAIPRGIRDGGLALGATRWQVTWRELLPAAMPGILTGTILALSRAIGETAPLIAVGAVTRAAANAPWSPLEAFTALPIEIYGFIQRPQADFRVTAAAAGIIVLMVLLVLMNSVAIVLRNRFQRRF
ncbi:MAG: phosphate ABC transporter permease PstA [Egibacteraceae bacterium]